MIALLRESGFLREKMTKSNQMVFNTIIICFELHVGECIVITKKSEMKIRKHLYASKLLNIIGIP